MSTRLQTRSVFRKARFFNYYFCIRGPKNRIYVHLQNKRNKINLSTLNNNAIPNLNIFSQNLIL